MRNLLLAGAGSFIGGACRYWLSTFIQSKSTTGFPYGTLIVNLFGCLVIGVLYGMFEKIPVSAESRLFVVTGMLGGFTTFSAFSVESFQLFRSGQAAAAIAYILSSVAGGLLLTFAGALIAKTSIQI